MIDLANVGVVAMVVIVVVDALKEQYPNLKGNMTRLIAMLIGGAIGALFQFHILAGVDTNLVSGLVSGALAVAGNTLANRIGGNTKGTNEPTE